MGSNSGQPTRPQVRMQHFQKEFTEQTSTNSYVDLDTVWDKSGFHNGTVQLWNTGSSNDIDYKILGSLNGIDYDIEVVSETTLGEDATTLKDVSNLTEGAYIPFIKVQIKSTVADNHSTVKGFGVCI